jgi:uncharacterized membrane protein
MLESWSVGLAIFALTGRRLIPRFASDNAWDGGWREASFANMAIGIGIAVVVALGLFVWQRRRALDTYERLARRLSPLALVGLPPFLFDNRLWNDRAIVFLALTAAWAFGARLVALTVIETPPAFPGLGARVAALGARLGRLVARPRAFLAKVAAKVDLPLVVVVLAACGYAIYFAVLTIRSHRNLHTAAFDMGLEDNLMWNLIHGGPLFRSTPFDGPTGTHLRNHATFFAFVMAPIYAAKPGPETLLVIQAVLMGSAAIPLHLFARRHLSRWLAALVALLFLAYPPLQGANLYDFHYLPLGMVFLFTVLYAVDAKRWWLAAFAALVAMSVREDVSFCLGVLGVFLLLSDRASRAGLALAALGGGYFLLMKLVVMPLAGHGIGHESFVNQYVGLVPPGGTGLRGVLSTVVGNPPFTANVLLEREKLEYVLLILVPVLFLPLTRPIGLLLLTPGFVFTLLSTKYWPLTQITFQYTSYWTPFVFLGVVLALERTREARHADDARGPARQRSLAIGLVAATLACTFLYGAMIQQKTLRGGFGPFSVKTTPNDLQRRADLAAVVASLPPDARVAASENPLPHISQREFVYTLRFGVRDAEYVLYEHPIRGDERGNVEPLLRDGSFGVIASQGAFVLMKQGAPKDGNFVATTQLGR